MQARRFRAVHRRCRYPHSTPTPRAPAASAVCISAPESPKYCALGGLNAHALDCLECDRRVRLHGSAFSLADYDVEHALTESPFDNPLGVLIGLIRDRHAPICILSARSCWSIQLTTRIRSGSVHSMLRIIRLKHLSKRSDLFRRSGIRRQRPLRHSSVTPLPTIYRYSSKVCTGYPRSISAGLVHAGRHVLQRIYKRAVKIKQASTHRHPNNIWSRSRRTSNLTYMILPKCCLSCIFNVKCRKVGAGRGRRVLSFRKKRKNEKSIGCSPAWLPKFRRI